MDLGDNERLYTLIIDESTSCPELAEVETSIIFEYLRYHRVVTNP